MILTCCWPRRPPRACALAEGESWLSKQQRAGAAKATAERRDELGGGSRAAAATEEEDDAIAP